MLDTPQELYDYFAVHATIFPAPKWNAASKAAELWLSYHAAPHPQPELLQVMIKVMIAYRQAGSGFAHFWYEILQTIAQLPPSLQIPLWQTIYATPLQESPPLKDHELTEQLLIGWRQLIAETKNAPVSNDQSCHLAQRCGATVPGERESLALVNAIDTWIQYTLTSPTLLLWLLFEQRSRSTSVPLESAP